ncbi:unnamed protein product [Leuciscus chuanchicus]
MARYVYASVDASHSHLGQTTCSTPSDRVSDDARGTLEKRSAPAMKMQRTHPPQQPQSPDKRTSGSKALTPAEQCCSPPARHWGRLEIIKRAVRGTTPGEDYGAFRHEFRKRAAKV